MSSRSEIEVTILSARDLKNVNWRNGPLKPYVIVWVDRNSKYTTRVDEEGDTCPFWDQTIAIPLPPGPPEDHTLHIDIVHAYCEENTKPLIGSARLNLVEVLDDVGFGQPSKRTLQLKRPSGRPQGKIDVKVIIIEPNLPPPPRYHAPPYGVPPPQYYYCERSYPYYSTPPPSGYPYRQPPPPPPPPPPYGYPSYSYGQPIYVQEEKEEKKSKSGGMGTGLAVGAVAGALGGLALAEGIDALEDNPPSDFW